MKLFRKMFGGGRDAARPLDLRASTGIGGTMSEAGIRVSADTSMSLSAVWGCVNLIAGSISSLPFCHGDSLWRAQLP